MSQVFITKLVIQTQSPMAINSGAKETGFDTQLARDASGLPYIPATSIAGVWGHLIEDCTDLGKSVRDNWFGRTEQASSLVISNGILHSADNTPVGPLLTEEEVNNDSLLKLLRRERPHHRERVAINDRGVAKHTGKYDQLLLPKGVRFSVTLKWTTSKRNDDYQLSDNEWQALLALWNDRKFAFGASTRNGLGRIKVIACEQHSFDLSDGPQAGHKMQQCLENKTVKGNSLPEPTENQAELLASLPLKALDNWRCGTGSTLMSKNTPDGSVALITYSEPEIEWNNNQAHLSNNKPVLCGSSVKGILAHRMAYHLRRHKQIWAEGMAEASHDEWQQSPVELNELFGFAAEKESEGKAGILYVDDAEISYTDTVLRTHNKIDRFTGGVQKGALFTEELLYQPQFTLNIWINRTHHLSENVKKALEDTISDLEMGLLPMGAGSGRGTSLVIPQPEETK